MLQEYKLSEYNRAKKNLYNSKRTSFGNSEDLAEWYVSKLEEQNYCCYYCETSIFTIKALIDKGLLKVRRVRGKGVRGPVLEIDKNDHTYIPDNCVLSCYYCNNDKSYTSAKEEYKQYFGLNRKKYFEELAKSIEKD